MNKLISILPDAPKNKATRSDCLALAELIKIDEPPGDNDPNITPEAVILLQLWIHMTVNTKDDHNIYSGNLDGHGLYPAEGVDHPIIDKRTGKFYIDQDVGLMHFKIPPTFTDSAKIGFMVGDIHRVTENFFLAAAHYFAHRLHNAFINNNMAKSYDDAKKLTLAALARIFVDIIKQHLNLRSDSEIVERDRRLQDNLAPENENEYAIRVIETREAAFAFLRWSHVLVPSTIKGIDIFSRDLDIVKSFSFADTFSASSIGMPDDPQVAAKMTQMNHTGGEPDIRKLTMTRFCEQDLCSWSDMLEAYGHDISDDDENLPLWYGIIKNARNGRPDMITGDVLCACIYESCWSFGHLDVELPNGMTTGEEIMAWMKQFPHG